MKNITGINMEHRINYTGLPEHMQGAMRRYIENRLGGGSFLNAVLSNDLNGAVARADRININQLPEYISWLQNHAPIDCWGSSERVKAWLTK